MRQGFDPWGGPLTCRTQGTYPQSEHIRKSCAISAPKTLSFGRRNCSSYYARQTKQYRARKQAVVTSVGRLFTREVLYQSCVARFSGKSSQMNYLPPRTTIIAPHN